MDLLCHIRLTRKSHDSYGTSYSCQNQKSQYKRRTTQIELTTVNIDISTTTKNLHRNSFNEMTTKEIHRNSINEMIV